MLSAAFKAEKNPQGTHSSCWKNNTAGIWSNGAALVPWSSHWILLRFSKLWPPDTSFFHGLQLSTGLPPKMCIRLRGSTGAAHPSHSWQLWKSQIPALRAAQPQANLVTSKGHLCHVSRAALFLLLWGQKYTKITALPLWQLSKTPLSPVQTF